MTDALNRRCALVLLAAMTLALGIGLIAWGPMPLLPEVHVHAVGQGRFGHALNVVATLPMLLAGLLGWRMLGQSGWAVAVRLPWMACFAFAVVSSLVSAGYHVAPSDAVFVLSNTAAAGLFTMLLLGFLAERVNPWFGTPQACIAGIAVVVVAGLYTGWCLRQVGAVDLRPLMLMHILPVLLIPAGALQLPGAHTSQRDWLLMLGCYLVARGFDAIDAELLHVTGWIGGHALMHVMLALTLGGLTRRAYLSCRASALAACPEVGGVKPTQANTSLNTSG